MDVTAAGYLGDTGYVQGSRREDGSWSGAPGTDPNTPGVKSYANYSEYWNAHPEMAPSSFTPTTGGLGGFSSFINPNQQNPVAPPLATNPTANTGPFTPTPNTGALAGVVGVGATIANKGNNMALPSIMNPQLNPTATQTQTAQTTAPDWYSNFLSGLATSGQTAVNQGGIAPASTLQNMAYGNAPTAISAGAPALQQATAAAGNVASTPTSSLIDQYLNPYTQSVVKSIGDLGTQQFREFTDPAVTSYGVATGQFGGSRAQDIRAKAARDAAMNITAQQTQAMNTGYNNALTAAQNQQNLGLNSANVLGNLSSQAQSQGIGGLNALSTLGAQQQTLSQAERNYPMTSLQNYANLISGLNVPTGTSQTVTGPAGSGQMQQSVLNQILGIGTGGMALWNSPSSQAIDPVTGQPKYDASGRPIMTTLGSSILDYFKNQPSAAPGASAEPTTTTPQTGGGGIFPSNLPDGTVVGSDGNPVVDNFSI